MKRLARSRFLTSMLVCGLAAVAVTYGVNLIRFATMSAVSSPERIVAALTPFTDKQGVGASAREALARIAQKSTPDRLEDALADHLSVAPASTYEWALLAQIRLNTGEGIDKAQTALLLSNLTGPNEAGVMSLRAVIGLSIWDVLSPSLKRAVIADAIGGWDDIGEHQRQVLSKLLAVADEKTHQDIRAALMFADPKGQMISADLGLEPAAQ